MIPVWSNNAQTTLAFPIADTDVTCTLLSGSGALFPDPAAGQVFSLTFISASNPNLFEIAYCTARSGDVCTIVRGEEGTTALAWNAGDLAQNLVTAGLLNGLAMAPHGELAFSASGNFTVPVGVFQVFGQVWAAGGGGGSGTTMGAAGSGAGGGGYSEGWFSVSPGDVIAINVGAAGVGSSGAFNGTDGGPSSFGAFCSATGGGGGFYSAGGPQGLVGAAGTGTGGQFNTTAQSGGSGYVLSGFGLSGTGGGTFSCPGVGASIEVGGHGMTPGGGGGAGANANNGGDGGDGRVIVRW